MYLLSFPAVNKQREEEQQQQPCCCHVFDVELLHQCRATHCRHVPHMVALIRGIVSFGHSKNYICMKNSEAITSTEAERGRERGNEHTD